MEIFRHVGFSTEKVFAHESSQRTVKKTVQTVTIYSFVLKLHTVIARGSRGGVVGY